MLEASSPELACTGPWGFLAFDFWYGRLRAQRSGFRAQGLGIWGQDRSLNR